MQDKERLPQLPKSANPQSQRAPGLAVPQPPAPKPSAYPVQPDLVVARSGAGPPEGTSRELFERIAESIVAEKFELAEKRISDVEFLKSSVVQDITGIKADMENLHEKYVSLQEDTVRRVEGYGRKLDAIMGEFKALENMLSLVIGQLNMLYESGRKASGKGRTA